MVKKLLKQFKQGQKGFTLIELLVVVAILGVLAAVAIPNVAKFIGQGSLEAANTELATVHTAVTAYMAENHTSALPDETNISPADSDILGLYISQPLKGSYTISVDGVITGTAYADAGITWDDTAKKWKK